MGFCKRKWAKNCFSRSHLPAFAPERFSPLDTLATLTAHIPEKRFQLVRYGGYYSNKARGQRRKRQQSTAALTPAAGFLPEAEQDDFRRHCRRAWARLIRKVCSADPLVCPRCPVTLDDQECIICQAMIDEISPEPPEGDQITFSLVNRARPSNALRRSGATKGSAIVSA